MAKYLLPAAENAKYSHIAASVVALVLCSGQPANYSGVYSAGGADAANLGSCHFSAGNITMSAATGGQDMSCAARASVSVSKTGTIDHVALVGGTSILFVTTATSKAVTVGDYVNVPAFKDTTAGPT